MLAFGEEGAVAGSQLTATGNTFINDRPAGGTAVLIAPSVTKPAIITNNIATGMTTFVAQASPRPRLKRNCLARDPRFTNRKKDKKLDDKNAKKNGNSKNGSGRKDKDGKKDS